MESAHRLKAFWSEFVVIGVFFSYHFVRQTDRQPVGEKDMKKKGFLHDILYF